jgi:hypothetical protein
MALHLSQFHWPFSCSNPGKGYHTNMNDIDIFRLTSGLLQFGVACYALRLGRLFKSMLTAWMLFGALSVLALLNLFLAVAPFDTGAQWGIKVDIIYSLLLLAGAMRFCSGFGNFLREEEAKRHALEKWESQVKEQWVELIKASEKLRQTISRLETEVAERKQAQEQAEKNLQELLAAPSQNENTFPQAVPGLDTEVIEQQPEPTSEVAEKNGDHALAAPYTNGDESLPVVAGFDTAIITPEPAEKNGEHLPTGSRQNGEELPQTALAPDRKITARKPSRPKRKKPALTRLASRARG